MKKIPNEYANQFKSFEEFKEFMSDKAKKQLVDAFNKTDLKNKEMRNTMDNVIDYNFEGYLKLLEQKTPKKIVYENMDMLYIYWNVFRGNVNDNRNEILEWLKKENIVETHRERVNAVKKYEKYKEDLAYFVRQTNKIG